MTIWNEMAALESRIPCLAIASAAYATASGSCRLTRQVVNAPAKGKNQYNNTYEIGYGQTIRKEWIIA